MNIKIMKEEAKVSVIIPVYNSEKWIKRTIENIEEQTYRNIEIILVDDNSKDNSLNIVKELIEKKIKNKVKLILNEKNMGVAFSRNIGIKEATGKYICFQDADDLWDKDKIKRQVQFMKEKNCAFSYTAFSYVFRNRKKEVYVPEKLNYKKALKDTRILVSSAMFDTEKINKNLLFMPNIGAEDIATWWNILKKSYIAYGLNDILVYYIQNKNSKSSNKIKSAVNRWYIYRKVEKFGILKSIYYFSFYVFYAIRKRI